MPVQTKICGTTSLGDAQLAREAGADFLGVILHHPASPRHVSLEVARQISDSVSLSVVALGVNQSLETWLHIAEALRPVALQLHGDEAPELVAALAARGFSVWKAIAGDENALLAQARLFSQAGAKAIVVDAREIAPGGTIYGGTGHLADWNGARRLVELGFRVVLAGGLDPDNVARAVETVQPWGVDVVSGVEASKGRKDAAKVRDFVRRAHFPTSKVGN
ncbi:MAG TPA: phosphoribosylanthranilate isomerase [Abditibacterium sp.]